MLHLLQAKEVEKDKTNMLNMILEDEELQRKMFVTAQQNHDKVYKVCKRFADLGCHLRL